MNAIAVLHCSDLHFGEILLNSAPHWLRVSGWNPHDALLCLAMRSALDDVWDLTNLEEDDDPQVVVSGDLSATGADGELAVAHSFLRSLWRLRRRPASDVAGFGLRGRPKARGLAAVAGNHDHWWGSRQMWALNPNVRGTHFRKTPWRRVWTAAGLELELYGLDSNAGLDPRRRNAKAIGRLDLSPNGEVNRLVRLLKRSDRRPLGQGTIRARALVMHHSLGFAGGITGFCVLEDASKKRVFEVCEQYRIAAVLTGHTHDFFLKPFPFPSSGDVWELRSASTLQWPAKRQPEPGFLAHKVWLDAGRARWQAWRYYWKGTAFVPKDRQNPCADFYCP